MTFILNVLHNDYSLLVADRLGSTNGPATIQIGSITIKSEKNINIEGIQKLAVTKDGRLAVGMAGQTKSHRYFSEFEKIETGADALIAVMNSSQQYFLESNRLANLSAQTMMENGIIASFFDPAASKYFSLLSIYTHKSWTSDWNYVNPGSVQLLHVGSGSGNFEKAVGLAEINRFIDNAKRTADHMACIEWINEAYAKVSEADPGVSKATRFLISTRLEPVFRPL